MSVILLLLLLFKSCIVPTLVNTNIERKSEIKPKKHKIQTNETQKSYQSNPEIKPKKPRNQIQKSNQSNPGIKWTYYHSILTFTKLVMHKCLQFNHSTFVHSAILKYLKIPSGLAQINITSYVF